MHGMPLCRRSALPLAAALAALHAPPAGAETLFDGHSLKGWRHAGTATFEVKNRTIRSVPGAGQLGLLYYARKRFRDFELTLQFRAGEGANSGVHLRFPKPGGCSWIDCGYEVQINDTAPDPRKTGSIYAFKDLDAKQAHAKPPNTWSTIKIRVKGQRYTVYRGGKRINDYRGSRRRRGYIGLQAHGGPQDVVAFRAIRIRAL
jgi:3-keto-disaccharide hydrolase